MLIITGKVPSGPRRRLEQLAGGIRSEHCIQLTDVDALLGGGEATPPVTGRASPCAGLEILMYCHTMSNPAYCPKRQRRKAGQSPDVIRNNRDTRGMKVATSLQERGRLIAAGVVTKVLYFKPNGVTRNVSNSW